MIDWGRATKKEHKQVAAIIDRVEEVLDGDIVISRQDRMMDLIACHTHGCPLDLDGLLDVWVEGRLYRNRGNHNHWLRVELVGIKSNRNGIGARLIATSGNLTQMREILGGTGYTQDELVAHFGLGARTKVDRLEIRWPSRQVVVGIE